MSIPIYYTKWGLANNYGSYIEINKDLLEYPNLYEPILKHELSHTEGLTIKDIKLDLEDTPNLNKMNLYAFMIKRPKTWIQFLPFTFSRGRIYFDLMVLLKYVLISLGLLGAYYFMGLLLN